MRCATASFSRRKSFVLVLPQTRWYICRPIYINKKRNENWKMEKATKTNVFLQAHNSFEIWVLFERSGQAKGRVCILHHHYNDRLLTHPLTTAPSPATCVPLLNQQQILINFCLMPAFPVTSQIWNETDVITNNLGYPAFGLMLLFATSNALSIWKKEIS